MSGSNTTGIGVRDNISLIPLDLFGSPTDGYDHFQGDAITSIGLNGLEVVIGVASDNYADGLAGNDTLDGNGGDDTLAGSEGSNLLSGGAGDDVLFGGAGNDTIDGGTGVNTIVLRGARNEYTTVNVGGTITITDSVAGCDGSDTLTNVSLESLWTAYLATWPPCSACSWASSLMWLAEHTRSAWGAGLARRPSAAGWRTARSAGRERAGACISTDA
jgi:Ca2+-binding RTX toxin-like protein